MIAGVHNIVCELSHMHSFFPKQNVNGSVNFCKLDGICQNIFIYGWVGSLDVKLNKWAILFITNVNKPFQKRISIPLLIEMTLHQFSTNLLNT